MTFQSPTIKDFLLKKWCVDKKYAPLYVEFLREQWFTDSECETIVKAQKIMSQASFKRWVAHYVNTEHLVPIIDEIRCDNRAKQNKLTILFRLLSNLWKN
jgi:hypothetical protein